ncbi:MAG: formate dehydrogenase [Steroidobacterales bacterium]
MRKAHRSDRLNPAAPATDPAPGTDVKRRGFLLALGVGGVGAAAAAARSMSSGVIEAESAAATPADGKGYAMTEHVRRYYRTAKV